MQQITEGKAKIDIPETKKISKKMEVFYNPVMKLNRDISILLLNSLGKKDMQIALPLAGSGVRGIRFLLELDKGIIESISMNDASKDAVNLILENINLNRIKEEHINVYNKDANHFLIKSTGFDYIDIDPFGTPNPFLDSAIKRLSRGGILAVTATDTSALAGSSPKACLRKYWAVPLKNEFMHESGVRILIRKVQLIGAEHDKALIPIFSFSKDHYFRIFLRCEKGKQKVDKIMKEHSYVLYCMKCQNRTVSKCNCGKCDCSSQLMGIGPMWIGKLWDKVLVKKMIKKSSPDTRHMLELILAESLVGQVGFYDIHQVVRKYKIKNIPKKLLLIEKLKSAGFNACESHFGKNSIRTNASIAELVNIIRN